MHPTESTQLTDHAQSLRRLACALLGSSSAADDLVQETYLLALAKGKAPGGAWLRGVLRNKFRERRRSAARRVRREACARPASPGADPYETAARIDEQRWLMEALARVREPLRTALWLRYFAGQTPNQIAHALDVPPATARSHLHRGLAALRTELDRRRGGRRAWQLALLPWLPSPSHTPQGLGGIMALAKSKTIAATLAVALLATGTSLAILGLRSEETGRPAPLPALSPAPAATEAQAFPQLAVRSQEGERTQGAAREDASAASPQVSGAVRVTGRVRASDGEPVEPVTVYVVAKGAPADAAPAGQQRCSASGLFDFCVDRLRGHWIVASGPAGDGWLRAFADGDAWNGRSLELVLHRAPERTIRVVDADGQGRQCRLVISAADPSKVRAWPGPDDSELGLWTRHTDEEGVARIRLPTRRAFIVRASAPGLVGPPRLVQEEETEIVIRLAPSAIVRVTPQGWQPGDHFLTGRLERTDLPHDAQPQLAGSQLDGTIRFQEGLVPGVYTLRVHSPDHETSVVEGLRIRHAGETVDVGVPVRKSETATLQLQIEGLWPGSEASPQVLMLWRRHDTLLPAWSNRGLHSLTGGTVTITGLPALRQDAFVVLAGERPLAGPAYGLWPRASETASASVRLRPASMREMPDLAGRSVRSWWLRDERGDDLPLYFTGPHGSQCYAGSELPPAGTRLGPYPLGVVTLHLEDEQGVRHELPLLP